MSSIHIRPRFKDKYRIKPEEVGNLVRSHLDTLDTGCTAEILPTFIVINIHPKEAHFWSPQLSISFEADDQDDSFTIIRGLYGPNPTVWAFFFYGYIALGILAMFLGMYGFSLYSLGHDARILWILPVLAVAALILYLIAQFGQKIGAEQMFTLHHFFEDSIGHRIHLD
ncbi:MAG: hypothetical protein K9G41_00470 [Flavobacteriales bacterium]|nr:hypothetical protein [Flavobacteriales bacterium]